MENSGKFENFCRMSADFEFLHNLIGPDITKQTTHLRKSTKERLAVTLRFLALGDSYKNLSYLFRISPQLISHRLWSMSALKKNLLTQIKVMFPINFVFKIKFYFMYVEFCSFTILL